MSNFHALEVVDRDNKTQLQVREFFKFFYYIYLAL